MQALSKGLTNASVDHQVILEKDLYEAQSLETEFLNAAKYPYNHVMRTISGHTVEFDDTPGANRIHIYHSSGTYIEISADGSQATHIKGNNTNVTLKDEKVFVEGKSTIIVKGEAEIYSDTKITLQAPEVSINGG